MFLKADVIYDTNIISAQAIAAAIEDLGFDAQVLEESDNNNERVNLIVSNRNALSNPKMCFCRLVALLALPVLVAWSLI